MDIIMLVLILTLTGVLSVIFHTKKRQSKTNLNQKPAKQIPGLSLSESRNDTVVFGELSLFIKDLHKRFGPVVSFYQDKVYTVSIAEPELMKKLRHLDVVPTDLFKQFEIVVGKESFDYQDVIEIRRRRKLYDHHFMLKACKSYSKCFLQIANEYVKRWKQLSKNDKIPLQETALEAALKGILRTNYGNYFKNEQHLTEFQQLFENMSEILEKEVKPNSTEEIKLKHYTQQVKTIIKKILTSRQEDISSTDRNLFIDVLLEDTQSTELQIGDSLTFIMSGFEAPGKILMWALYELCAQPDLQEKLYQELKSVLGDQQISLETLPKLKYLAQVVDETIRFRLDTTFNVRVLQENLRLGDYVIPANSRLFMNTGIAFFDNKYFANPEKFDPEHFSPENTKTRHPYAWKPFGFAGKRQCPGQSYARIKISIFLSEWIRQFKFKLVPDQEIKFVQGFMWRLENDVWVTLESRC